MSASLLLSSRLATFKHCARRAATIQTPAGMGFFFFTVHNIVFHVLLTRVFKTRQKKKLNPSEILHSAQSAEQGG